MLIELINGNVTENEYLLINDIKVVYKKLPKKIYGFIHRYRGINIITINWNISKEKKRKALLHELAHLELNHLDKNDLFEFKFENIEDEADRYLNYLLNYNKDISIGGKS